MESVKRARWHSLSEGGPPVGNMVIGKKMFLKPTIRQVFQCVFRVLRDKNWAEKIMKLSHEVLVDIYK